MKRTPVPEQITGSNTHQVRDAEGDDLFCSELHGDE